MQTELLSDSISRSDFNCSKRKSSPIGCLISKGTGGGGNLAEMSLTIVLM